MNPELYKNTFSYRGRTSFLPASSASALQSPLLPSHDFLEHTLCSHKKQFQLKCHCTSCLT
uniref:Uncharacterized protein n=1 Tax=Anguilla anguilla TaxID=7936 RepID=A0A0E9WMS0_ANGAN